MIFRQHFPKLNKKFSPRGYPPNTIKILSQYYPPNAEHTKLLKPFPLQQTPNFTFPENFTKLYLFSAYI
jgi:hypothetical protein